MPVTQPKDIDGGWFKFGNLEADTFDNEELIVHVKFSRLHPNANPTDEWMAKHCDLGLGKYQRAKRRLKAKGYLKIVRYGGLGNKQHHYYGRDAVKNWKKW